MSGKKEALTLDQDGQIIKPLPPAKPPKIDLRNISSIRREINAVYRDARSGKLEATEASKLVYILGVSLKACEAERAERLEDAAVLQMLDKPPELVVRLIRPGEA